MEDENDRTRIQLHDPLVGTVFDRRFHIDFRIAIGGFGAIYHATHKKTGHQFALKILHPRLASDPGVIARFQREGETLTRLRDPHTIIAYELGEAADGTLFIVLELLHGESLFERFRAHGPIEWKRMARIARGVCSSLEEAHALGIIHRDLKPTNINLERTDDDPDFVKVLDFGIAKILRESDMDSADLTNAGQMIGTLDYMSPEQMVGGACTGQTDIYTLGIVMYEMIAGRRPFAEANSPAAVLAAMLRTTPEPLSARIPVPKAMERIVMRCLEREPEQRWTSVVELGEAIDRLLAGDESAGRADVTKTMQVHVEEESTVLEQRQRLVVTSPYPAQDGPPDGEAPTVPAPSTPRSKSPSQHPPRASSPRPQTLSGRPAPPPEKTPPPLFSLPPKVPPAQRDAQTMLATPRDGQRTLQTTPRDAQATVVPSHRTTALGAAALPAQSRSGGLRPPSQADSGGLATPLANSGLALFPPQEPPTVRKVPTQPPPMEILVPPGAVGPLPHAPPRPVMDLQSFAPPQQFPPTANVAPLPPGPGMPGFDMSQIAARDAAVRRIVWIVVLAVAAVIGVVVASQL